MNGKIPRNLTSIVQGVLNLWKGQNIGVIFILLEMVYKDVYIRFIFSHLKEPKNYFLHMLQVMAAFSR